MNKIKYWKGTKTAKTKNLKGVKSEVTQLILLTTVDPRYNEGPRDWQNMFPIKRFRYIEVLFNLQYTCNVLFLGQRISFVIPRTSLYRGSTVGCFTLIPQFSIAQKTTCFLEAPSGETRCALASRVTRLQRSLLACYYSCTPLTIQTTLRGGYLSP